MSTADYLSPPVRSLSGEPLFATELIRFHRLSPQMIKALVDSREGLVPHAYAKTMQALAARQLIMADGEDTALYPDGAPLTEDGQRAVRVFQDPTTTALYEVDRIYWYCGGCRPAEGAQARTFGELRLGIFRYRCDGCGMDLDRGDDKE